MRFIAVIKERDVMLRVGDGAGGYRALTMGAIGGPTRLRRERYYDAEALRAGRAIDFDRHWFSESSLSNDYDCERGLDRFGWVPEHELCANLYMVYGARGEEPPALDDVPPPP